MHGSTGDVDVNLLALVDDEEAESSQFGIWLRHRRIDGALNRVPLNFYAVSLMFLISSKCCAKFQV